MAHNLATIDGRTAMAYQGETPWHQLGTRIASLTSVPQAMAAAAIDYRVRAEALFLADGTPVPMRKAIIREGTDGTGPVIATVAASYQILQHTEGFAELDVLCTDHGMTIEAAGALGKGERVWMLFRMPTTLTPVPGDDVRGYLLATTGHDGNWAYTLKPTPIRVVCQNTLDAAAGGEMTRAATGIDFVRLHHTKGNADKLAIAADVVRRIVASFEQTGETFAAFAARKMSDAEVIRYIETLFPVDATKPSKVIEARRKTVAELVWTGTGSDLARSSTDGAVNAWAAYNAVTEYFDHVRVAEAKSTAGVRRANESAIFGTAADIKLRALRLAQQLVAA
jgi:phage/plasmid-like protein (TIGR03299 family)